MPLTQEQLDAIEETGNVCLASCPGSGKTRTIVAKALACVECVRGTPRRVACITHTQVASDEIESRLAESSFGGDDRYCEVTTIHSFALRNILGPWAVDATSERPSYACECSVELRRLSCLFEVDEALRRLLRRSRRWSRIGICRLARYRKA